MEHRKRSLSSILDDDILDIEKAPDTSRVSPPLRRRATSASIDEQLDEYTDFVYNGTFNVTKSIFVGFINLICPCRNRKSEVEVIQ